MTRVMGKRPPLRRSLAHNSAQRAADLREDAPTTQKQTNRHLGLLIAATHSGAGKTITTLALLAALHKRGLRVQAGKAGPDFIDPTHHAQITGRASCNLDTWMGGEAAIPRILDIFCADNPDVVIIEGAMGLYDGAGNGAGSSADVARVLNLPILLLIDVRGMAQSVAAIAEGFLQHRPHNAQGELLPPAQFAGIVCTHAGGSAHASMIREACAHLPVPLLGILPRADAPHIASRHLGLVMAHEIDFSAKQHVQLAEWIEKHLDIDALLTRLRTMPNIPHSTPCGYKNRVKNTFLQQHTTARPRIAIARDAAFCFCYADLFALLKRLGAEPVFFSPLEDTILPQGCNAVYLPGGYPELHAAQLAKNTVLQENLRAFAERGGRIHGECGGFIYLTQHLDLPDGQRFSLCGCLPLSCQLDTERAALGYREVSPYAPNHKPYSAIQHRWRGHEFHYSRLQQHELPPACRPLWHVRGRTGAPLPDEGCVYNNISGSWVHLYPEGSVAFWRQLIQGVLPH